MVLRSLNNAVVLLDKPSGRTSYDVINDLKRSAGIKKLGHSGTLDKFASGLLVVCTGRFTRLTRYFLESDKRYTGTIQLGMTTDTCDLTGEILSRKGFDRILERDLFSAVSDFTGLITQVPPEYSSLKIKGERASDRVRRGEEVHLEPRNVRVYHFIITGSDINNGTVDFDIKCSKGTYIRSIARDFGEKLKTGAFLSALRRTESGIFNVDAAASSEEILDYFRNGGESSFLLDAEEALSGFGKIILDSEGSHRVKNGAPFSIENVKNLVVSSEKRFIVLDEEQNLIAIAEIDIEEWHIKYDAVFN